MAVRSAVPTLLAHGAILYTWSGLANGDTGEHVEVPGHADKSVQIEGTFGAGGTCVIQGSNNGTQYQTVTDPQGNAISKTAASLEMVSEHTRYIRPNITAGDGTTSLSVSLMAKRT